MAGGILGRGDSLLCLDFVSQLAHKQGTSLCSVPAGSGGQMDWGWGPDEGISSGLGGEAAVKLNGLMRMKSWHRSQILLALCFTGLGNCQDLCSEELFSFLVVDNL